MSKTKNYGFFLCDDDTKTFREWREEINGTNGSNMIMIDAALGMKANKSDVIEAILYADSWKGENSPYTQDIVVEGLEDDQNGTIALSHSATVEQRDNAREALLAVTGQATEQLTVSADGELPSIDIPVTIILFG